MKPVKCVICASEMSLTKIFKTKKWYKARRYKCPICDFEKTIFGAGYYDNGNGLEAGIKNDTNKMYNQQERNNL